MDVQLLPQAIDDRGFYLCLLVESVSRSQDFFAALGFRFDPQLTGHGSACLIVNDCARIVVLQRPCRGKAALSGALAIRCGSREEAVGIQAKAIAAGATVDRPEVRGDRLFSAPFKDPDGYAWEAVWIAAP